MSPGFPKPQEQLSLALCKSGITSSFQGTWATKFTGASWFFENSWLLTGKLLTTTKHKGPPYIYPYIRMGLTAVRPIPNGCTDWSSVVAAYNRVRVPGSKCLARFFSRFQPKLKCLTVHLVHQLYYEQTRPVCDADMKDVFPHSNGCWRHMISTRSHHHYHWYHYHSRPGQDPKASEICLRVSAWCVYTPLFEQSDAVQTVPEAGDTPGKAPHKSHQGTHQDYKSVTENSTPSQTFQFSGRRWTSIIIIIIIMSVSHLLLQR